MKNFSLRSDVFFKAKGQFKVPRRTVGEMAEEFAVTKGQLSYAIANSLIPPPQPFETKTAAHMKKWYVAKEMRAWWKEHQKAIQAPR